MITFYLTTNAITYLRMGYYFTALILAIVVLCVGFFSQISAQEQKSYYIYVDPLPDYAKSYASNVIYDTTQAWERANPNIKFYIASSWSDADFEVQWIKDTTGSGFLAEAFLKSNVMVIPLAIVRIAMDNGNRFRVLILIESQNMS